MYYPLVTAKGQYSLLIHPCLQQSPPFPYVVLRETLWRGWAHTWSQLHWTWRKLLAASHWSQPCSHPATKNLPCKAKTKVIIQEVRASSFISLLSQWELKLIFPPAWCSPFHFVSLLFPVTIPTSVQDASKYTEQPVSEEVWCSIKKWKTWHWTFSV